MQLILYSVDGLFIRSDRTAADKRYADDDIFFSQHSRKPHVSGSLFGSVYLQYERISATTIIATK
jgi:hypothetical protein